MKPFLKILLFFSVFFSFDFSNAQIVTWQRVYGSNIYEGGKYGIQTFDGGYMVLSVSKNWGNYISDCVYLLKLNQSGGVEWSRLFEVPEVGVCIKQTDDSGFVIAGYGNDKGLLIRIDNKGNIVWRKYYTIDNGPALFYSVQILNSGEIIACGRYSNPIQAYFVKTDENGNLIWQKSFTSSTFFCYALDIIESKDKFLYTTGITYINGYSHTLIGKISSIGDFIWFKHFGPTSGSGNSQYGKTIIQESNNSLILAGTIGINYVDKNYTYRIDSSGNKITENIYSPTSLSTSMCKTMTGGYMLAGIGFSKLSEDVSVIKINSTLILQNSLLLNSGSDETDEAYSINNTTDGGFLIVGSTTYGHFSDQDGNILVIKTDSVGYAPLVKIRELINEIPSSFKLYQNFPNPFNSNTKIKFDVNKSGTIKLKIFNSLGVEILTLLDRNLHPGSYEIDFEGSYISSGIYFYKLFSEENVVTKKMIQIK